jgi:hypothetical protein
VPRRNCWKPVCRLRALTPAAAARSTIEDRLVEMRLDIGLGAFDV